MRLEYQHYFNLQRSIKLLCMCMSTLPCIESNRIELFISIHLRFRSIPCTNLLPVFIPTNALSMSIYILSAMYLVKSNVCALGQHQPVFLRIDPFIHPFISPMGECAQMVCSLTLFANVMLNHRATCPL